MKNTELRRYEALLKKELDKMGNPFGHSEAVGKIKEPDTLDQAVLMAERDVNVQLTDAKSRKRMAIVAALNRIQKGTFGICTSCEESIGEVRLNARPEAALCLGCQEEVERSKKSDLHGGEEFSFA